MKLWEKIAMFMIYLIISLPIVFAQELTIQKFQGKDNAKGYARTDDEFTVEVLAKIPGEDVIDKEQVRLYLEDWYTPFDSCTVNGTYHRCTIFEPDFASYEPLDFSIELRDDSDNIVGQETKTLVVDNQAPVIKEMSVDPPISNGPITVSYAAEDYSLTFGDTAQCSGLKAIKITAGQTQLVTDSAALGECTKDNQLELNIDTAGKKQICIAALDYVNYASAPTCQEVTIDKAPPEIEEVSIMDETGIIVLTHVHSGEERMASINAVITDDGEVDQTTVAAKFSELNPNIPDFIPPDLIEGNLYSWQNIPVSEVSPCKLTVNAKDTLGNEVSQEFPCTIKADDTPPVSKGIIPDAQRDGIPLYGQGTALVIELEDKDNDGNAGIGMMAGNALLDLSDVGMGSQVEPDLCARLSGASWACSWFMNPPVTMAEGTYTVVLSGTTADDLNNQIGTDEEFEIIYDNTGPRKPELIDFKIVSGESGVTYQGGAIRGDFVQYKVRSGDFETAYANFTDINGDAKTIATSCEEVENATQDCTFEELVDLDGPYTAEFTFDFYDDALNRASTNTRLEVYGLDNVTNASKKYWKSPPVVTCSPSVIDRQTATLIPAMAACRIDLQTPRKDISTLAIAGPASPDECKGDIALNVNDLYMVNTAEGSKSPYMFIKLEPKNFYVNNLKINCSINVYSKREEIKDGKKRYFVTPFPQQLPVNISLPFYNNPFELAHENIDKEIKKAFKTGLASQKWLGELRQWIYYAELICWVKVLITNVIGALYLVTIILKVIGQALKSNPFTAAAGEAANQAGGGICEVEESLSEVYGGTVDGIFKFLDAICSVINCASAGKGGIEGALGGGGNPLCTAIDALLKEIPGLGPMAEEAGISLMPSIKDSLIMSLFCLCLPGIIYNLEKLRQIDCFKAVCLHDMVKEGGYPKSFCNEMHGYLTCMFVIGELFSIIPFAAFFDKIIDMIVTMISDPIALITVGLGAICNTTCPTPDAGIAYIGCALLKVVSVVMEAIGAIKQATDKKNEFGKPPNTQYCRRMEKIEKDY